jgi:NAD(P)-dependent dehydrogenase (short-subunit alcohol dehydrogenase family)
VSTVLVTGSTRGLGHEVARRLDGRGETVIHHGREQADLSSLDEVRRFAREVGAVDLLLNNAYDADARRRLWQLSEELCGTA